MDETIELDASCASLCTSDNCSLCCYKSLSPENNTANMDSSDSVKDAAIDDCSYDEYTYDDSYYVVTDCTDKSPEERIFPSVDDLTVSFLDESNSVDGQRIVEQPASSVEIPEEAFEENNNDPNNNMDSIEESSASTEVKLDPVEARANQAPRVVSPLPGCSKDSVPLPDEHPFDVILVEQTRHVLDLVSRIHRDSVFEACLMNLDTPVSELRLWDLIPEADRLEFPDDIFPHKKSENVTKIVPTSDVRVVKNLTNETSNIKRGPIEDLCTIGCKKSTSTPNLSSSAPMVNPGTIPKVPSSSQIVRPEKKIVSETGTIRPAPLEQLKSNLYKVTELPSSNSTRTNVVESTASQGAIPKVRAKVRRHGKSPRDKKTRPIASSTPSSAADQLARNVEYGTPISTVLFHQTENREAAAGNSINSEQVPARPVLRDARKARSKTPVLYHQEYRDETSSHIKNDSLKIFPSPFKPMAKSASAHTAQISHQYKPMVQPASAQPLNKYRPTVNSTTAHLQQDKPVFQQAPAHQRQVVKPNSGQSSSNSSVDNAFAGQQQIHSPPLHLHQHKPAVQPTRAHHHQVAKPNSGQSSSNSLAHNAIVGQQQNPPRLAYVYQQPKPAVQPAPAHQTQVVKPNSGQSSSNSSAHNAIVGQQQNPPRLAYVYQQPKPAVQPAPAHQTQVVKPNSGQSSSNSSAHNAIAGQQQIQPRLAYVHQNRPAVQPDTAHQSQVVKPNYGPSTSKSSTDTTTAVQQQIQPVKRAICMEMYYKLINVFPNVDQEYIKNLCPSDWAPGDRDNQLAGLVEMILEAGETVPRIVGNSRRERDEADAPGTSPDEVYENLLGIFPDADPHYLREFAEKKVDGTESIKQFVERNLESRDYPTREQYMARLKITEQQRQYTHGFKVKQYLSIIPDPKKHFTNAQRKCNYSTVAIEFLKSHFNKMRVTTISSAYQRYRYNMSLASEYLEGIDANLTSKRIAMEMPTEDILLLQEMAYIKHKKEITDYIAKAKKAEEDEFKTMKAQNLLLECQCCFDAECVPSKCCNCDNGHIFCDECVINGTKAKLADGDTRIKCFINCGSEFSLSVLQEILAPTTFSILLKKRQAAEVIAAGVEGLVSCPFCHFASIPPENEKIFKCLNPECTKESCRLCKELSHVPLKCDEVMNAEKARLYIEEKMTAALARKCYRCKRSFFKEEGCNKITCVCGAMMCYLCDKPITDYSHFQGQGLDNQSRCPLHSDTIRLDAVAVRKVAEQAQLQVLKENPNMIIDTRNLLPEDPYPQMRHRQGILNAEELTLHAQRVLNDPPV